MDISPQFDGAKIFNFEHHKAARQKLEADSRRGAVNPEVFKNPKLRRKEISNRVRTEEVLDLAKHLTDTGWHLPEKPRVRPKDTRSTGRKVSDWLGLTLDERE